MAMLTKAEILAADDIKKEVVDVPEWGGSVLVHAMSGTQRDQFESAIVAGNKSGTIDNVRALLVALTVVDEVGELLFAKKDIVALGKKSAAALQRVFDVSQKLNGIGAAAIEEQEGNS